MSMDFSPVSLDRQDEYLARLALSPQKVSDYSFVNIWGWAENYGLEWSFGERHVWIRQTKPELVCWAPVGPWRDFDWSKCPGMSEVGKMIRVPEELAALWRRTPGLNVRVEEARDHWDYVYSVEELINLSGNRFHKKKNLLNQFVKKYGFEYHSMTMDCVEEALALQAAWCEWRDCESSDTLTAENEAIYRVLKSWDRLAKVFGGVIRVDGKVAAYTVAEPLSDEMAVIHFEKAGTQFKGAYQAINKLFLERDASGFAYVNREQDLGDPGLRKAKESYNPVGYLKKFLVSVSI